MWLEVCKYNAFLKWCRHSISTCVLFKWWRHPASTYDICFVFVQMELNFKISFFAFACCCLLGRQSTPWRMELFLNLNSNRTCGLKSVSMYFSSDGVTQQVHMIPGVLVKRINFHSRKWRKKAPKSIENPPKIDVWGSLAALLEPLDRHLGHMFPKASKIQSFGGMCPRCLSRGSKKAPKQPQTTIFGRFSMDLGAFFRYFRL